MGSARAYRAPGLKRNSTRRCRSHSRQSERCSDLHRAWLPDLRLQVAGLRLPRHRMTIDLEREYNNRARVPENPGIMAGWANDSATYRETKPPRVLRYGDGERHTLDLFEAGDGPAVMYL